ncbi:MAG: response regulator [Lentisphaerae bacterium]|nr:response regulator [Lentisphaerota bacterium]
MNNTPVRVLLIEDDEEDFIIARNCLSTGFGGGVALTWVKSIDAARTTLLAGNPFDILLLDLTLPDAQGLETFAQVRATGTEIPVILLTGLADDMLAMRAIQDGAQDYLPKQRLAPDLLARAIRYAIERSRADQALRTSELRYRQLLAATPSYTYSVMILNDRTVTTNHSAGCQTVTGYTPEEYASDPYRWFDMVHPGDRERVQAYAQNASKGGRQAPIEHRLFHKNGSLRWVRNTIVWHASATNHTIRYDGLIEDITERKLAEEELRKARDELETRVQERTQELKRANDELRNAIKRLEAHDRDKSQFVSNVSHELRTPLSSMSYAIENLLRGVVGPVSAEVRVYLVMLQEDCRRLSNTVSDILDLSRIDAGTFILNMARVPFATFVRRVIDAQLAHAEFRQRTLRIHDAVGGFVECDPPKMERALLNILQNALKFTHDGGTITVQVGPDPDHPGYARCVVDDDGIGIPAQYLDRVSERYFRVGEHVDGTGLGLSICKEIVNLHSGRLEIASPVPGQPSGTRVAIALPTVPPPRVLVADDDAAMRDLLTAQLTDQGYQVVATASGQAAWASLRENGADLLLADLRMADMDGWELLTRVRAEPGYRALPMIAITGIPGTTGQHLLDGFAIPLLRKPWTTQTLFAALEKAIVPGLPVATRPADADADRPPGRTAPPPVA